MSTVRKLFSVNAIIAVSLVVGFLNNVAISGFFGLNRFVDAYFAASILGTMFMYLIVDYLGRNFLPIYAARYRESPDDAASIASTVITLMALFASATVLVLVMLARPIFTFLLPGFDADGIEIVTRMFTIQAPAIVLMTVNNFHQFVWQHDEHYNRVVFGRLSISSTIFLFIVAGYLAGNVYFLAAGFLFGHLAAAIVLAVGIPYRFRPNLDLKQADVKKILANSALLSGSGLITRLRGPIQHYFASQLGEGAISAVAISLKMCRPIYESLLMGVRMIVFSKSSKQAAEGDFRRLARLYDYAISAILLGLVPLAVWIGMNANDLIEVVFLRGEFTLDMAAVVGMALLGAVATIVFHGVQQILSNSFYAMQKIQVPLIVMPFGTVLFFFATQYFSQKYGVFGLTFSSSLVSAVVTAVLLIAFSTLVSEFSGWRIGGRMFGYFAVSMLFGYAGQVAADMLALDGILRLVLTLAVLGAGYFTTLFLVREGVLIRITGSIQGAIAGRS